MGLHSDQCCSRKSGSFLPKISDSPLKVVSDYHITSLVFDKHSLIFNLRANNMTFLSPLQNSTFMTAINDKPIVSLHNMSLENTQSQIQTAHDYIVTCFVELLD